MASPVVDEQYYQVARPNSLSERVVIAARDRIYAGFIEHAAPQTAATIADVGVSDVVTDAANLMERLYPHPENITALGLGDGIEFSRSYPLVSYTQIKPEDPLPFADKHFDIATANAVLEHVGSHAAQVRFVSEMCRIARKVYITVPHRYFPVEHHTGLPFAHYNTSLFSWACALTGKDEWSREENLILMTKQKLQALIPAGAQATIGYTGIHLGPLSSNLFLHIRSDI